ncbi:APC family permease [Thermogemmatispora onikobensis]|uniref:APC family permease n=1 Tax=Thermogemmatispora onikobensis TaxID=732234 RepID=UPI000853704B|nr:APC family permease [Thermogemmatispora onikobensis]
MSETSEHLAEAVLSGEQGEGVAQPGLRRNAIGLSEVLFQSITSMAPATAVTAALTPAIPYTGASLPLAVLLATVASTLVAANIGQLAIHIPSAGGLYTYISRGLGARLGFLAGWIFLLAQPLLLPFISLVWGTVSESLLANLTGLHLPWYVWVLIGNGLLLLLTYFGIKLSADASLVLGLIEIGVLLALSFTMIITAGDHNDLTTFTPAFSVDRGLGGWLGIGQGMVFAFLAFLGFEAAAPLAEESEQPRRTIPQAVIFSALGIGLFYVLASYAGVIGWGPARLDSYVAASNPWVVLGARYWGVAGPVILSLAVINSSLGNGNAGINAATRVVYALARAGALPSFLGHLSRHRTPSVAIALHVALATLVALATGFLFGVSVAFSLLGTVLTLGFLLLYIAACLASAAFYFRERRLEFGFWRHVVLSLVPTIILFFPLAVQVYPLPAYPLNLALPILVLWIVLGVIYLGFLQWRHPKALERGKAIFLEEEEEVAV